MQKRRTGLLASKCHGFSLVELMVVVTIVAILASAAMPFREIVIKREKEQELRLALRQIRSAIDAYKQAADEGLVEKKVDESGYPRKLEDLVEGVPNIKDPKKSTIYFLRRLPRDPMLADIDQDMSDAETWGKRSYASPPNEPEEGDDLFDIYSRSDRKGLNGVPYSQW